MTRPIKFRAWDGARKEMVWEGDMDAPNLFIGLSGEVCSTTDRKPADLTILQSTGLTDKNGKEIYEGDILGHWGRAVWAVGWDGERGRWALVYSDGRAAFSLGRKDHLSKTVIGNIYENPELLNEKGT